MLILNEMSAAVPTEINNLEGTASTKWMSSTELPPAFAGGTTGISSMEANTSDVLYRIETTWIWDNTTYPEEKRITDDLGRFVILTTVLGFFCLATIFGNSLVMIAVYRERTLRSVTNYFIVSLAAADLLVGLVVMPFALIDTVTGGWWYFSNTWCDLWHAIDILGCTASICHLCVISLDRFWAITRPLSYPTMMTPKVVVYLIVLVWLVSCVISFPCIAWWRAVTEPNPPNACIFPSNAIYLILSSCVSFYLPSFIMMVLYIRIYRTAVRQVHHIRTGTKRISSKGKGKNNQNGKSAANGAVLRIHRGGGNSSSSLADSKQSRRGPNHVMGRRLMSRVSREHKAAKTLGIVVGVFIVCWLPFFVVNVLGPLCPQCITSPEILLPVITWLGYINSALNPAIYACTSRSFKKAFKRILCCCCGEKRKGYRFTRTNTQFMSMDSSYNSTYNMGELTTSAISKTPSPLPS